MCDINKHESFQESYSLESRFLFVEKTATRSSEKVWFFDACTHTPRIISKSEGKIIFLFLSN